MSYTYAKVTTLSPLYLDDFYRRHPGLDEQDYDTQFAALMKDTHVWANHISRNLAEHGVDAHEIVYSAGPLQQAWARENGVDAEGPELLVAQLKKIAPDVVFLHISYPMYADFLPLVRDNVPGVKLIHGNIGVGFEREHFPSFAGLDFVITNESGLYSRLKEAGANPYHVYHAFEHTLLPRIQEMGPLEETDFLFVGGIVLSNGYHLRRGEFLTELVDRGVNLQVRSNPVEVKANIPPQLAARIKPPVWGISMYRALLGAKTAFNIHIDALPAASNMRLFEATGAGTCLVTDRVPELEKLFEDGTEVVTYDSPEECADKVRWLLDHPAERQAIAEAGQKRTLRDHRLKDRVAILNDIILKELKAR